MNRAPVRDILRTKIKPTTIIDRQLKILCRWFGLFTIASVIIAWAALLGLLKLLV